MPQPDASMFKLDPAPKIITFDCYGTLVQWYKVLLSEIGAVLSAQGRDAADASAVLDRHCQLCGLSPERSGWGMLAG